MYCTKCGKELYPDDRFCAYCGAEVRNREKPKPKYEDIVFNPPFKIEAEKKTREILQAASQPQPEETPKQTEPVSFDWKLEEPTRKQPAKTEEVDFNWESVLERRNLSRTQEINIERIRAAQLEAESGLSFAPREDANPPAEEEPERYEEARIKPEEPREISEPAHTQPEAAQAEAASIEALERELFGTKKPVQEEGASSQPEQPKEPKRDERFHTYHQKTDAFDELLKQEKERVDAMQEEYGRSPRNLDYTWVSEVFPPKRDEPIAAGQVEAENTHPKQEAQSPQPQPETEPARTPIAEVPAQPEVSVEVVQPTTPKTIDLTLSIKIPEGEAEPEGPAQDAELPPSKTKLRYSDIFPRVDVDYGTGAPDAAGAGGPAQKEQKEIVLPELDDDEEEKPKKHIFTRIVITLLVVMIIAEGAVLGIKFFAPDSEASRKINDMLAAVMDLFTGQEKPADDDELPQTSVNAEEEYYTRLVNEAAADTTTIGQTQYNAALCYDTDKTYAFEEIPETTAFQDMDWTTDQNGRTVTYGQALLRAVVRYYDGWKERNQDDSLVGINVLEIGEIRVGAEGFYLLCKVTYAGSDGKDEVRYQSVYARASEDAMSIDTVKEEKI